MLYFELVYFFGSLKRGHFLLESDTIVNPIPHWANNTIVLPLYMQVPTHAYRRLLTCIYVTLSSVDMTSTLAQVPPTPQPHFTLSEKVVVGVVASVMATIPFVILLACFLHEHGKRRAAAETDREEIVTCEDDPFDIDVQHI